MRTGIFEKFEACQMLVISPIFSPGHYKWCVPSNVRRIPPKIGPANLRVIYIWRARLKCVLIRVVYLRPMWMLTLRYLLSRSVLCDQLTTGIDQIRRTQLESNSGDNVSHVLILILIIHQGCFGSMAGSCFSKWGVGLNFIQCCCRLNFMYHSVGCLYFIHRQRASYGFDEGTLILSFFSACHPPPCDEAPWISGREAQWS